MAGKLTARERAHEWLEAQLGQSQGMGRQTLVNTLAAAIQAHEDAVRKEDAEVADESAVMYARFAAKGGDNRVDYARQFACEAVAARIRDLCNNATTGGTGR